MHILLGKKMLYDRYVIFPFFCFLCFVVSSCIFGLINRKCWAAISKFSFVSFSAIRFFQKISTKKRKINSQTRKFEIQYPKCLLEKSHVKLNSGPGRQSLSLSVVWLFNSVEMLQCRHVETCHPNPNLNPFRIICINISV